MAVPSRHRVLKDRRTKNLTRRLQPGDIVLLCHTDLDTTAARTLVEKQVAAVVNAVPSISGRYPNRGPEVLMKAGIPLLDAVGMEAFEGVQDGAMAALEGDTLRFDDGRCVQGLLLTPELLSEQLEAAHANLSLELDHFARNTLAYLDNEKGLLFDAIDVPKLTTRFANRHVLIVVRGEGYKDDLALLHNYMLDTRPVLLAVDGGADALLEARLKPDVILGDMDSVSDRALRCGAELVVHGYARGDQRGAPGLERIEALGLKDAARRRVGGLAYRRGRHALLSGGVSRQRAGGHGEHLPDPPAHRLQTRRCQRHRAPVDRPASPAARTRFPALCSGDTDCRRAQPFSDRADPAPDTGRHRQSLDAPPFS